MLTFLRAMMTRSFFVLLICLLLISIVTACGNQQSDGNNQENNHQPTTANPPATTNPPTTNTPTTPANDSKPKEPIELTITPFYLSMTDEEFDQILIQPLKAKYPHMTLKVHREDIAKLVAAGETPDIVYAANSRFYVVDELDLPLDLSDYVKSYNVDLSKFASPNIDWIKELGPKGEVYAIPFALNHMAMFYNKDLFDKRGIDEPKNDLTWEEYLDLVRSLTFTEGDTQYRGGLFTTPEILARVRSLPLVDQQTNKALINNDNIKSILELAQAYHNIPGILVDGKAPAGASFYEGLTAMWMNWIPDTVAGITNNAPQLSFDLVGAPTFRDIPGVTIDPGAQLMVVSKTSKYKEEAFQAIQFFASPEVQTIMNRFSRLTALADENIRKDFLVDLEITKGKNIQGALQIKPAKMVTPNPYHVLVASRLNASINEIVSSGKDINTVMREVQEAADKAIQEEIAKRNN